jgi:adenylate cyclase class 2
MPTHLNVEIKARCSNPEAVLTRLADLGAVAQGVDHQIDTYFHAASGRLKLRSGNIENSLIHYLRDDQAGPKDSHVTLLATRADESSALRHLLAAALGVAVEVDKHRHILWIDNVKFHVDTVVGLGTYV